MGHEVAVPLGNVIPGERVAQVRQGIEAAGVHLQVKVVLLSVADQRGVVQHHGTAVRVLAALQDADAVAVEDARLAADHRLGLCQGGLQLGGGVMLEQLAGEGGAIQPGGGAGVARVAIAREGVEVLVGQVGVAVGCGAVRLPEGARIADGGHPEVHQGDVDEVVEEGARLWVGEEVGIAVGREAVGVAAAHRLHQAVDADEIELDQVVAGAFVAAPIAGKAVHQGVGAMPDPVEGVIDHVVRVGAGVAVVVHHQGTGQCRRLVKPSFRGCAR